MKKFKKPLSYVLLFGLVFLFGWESSSYYILKKSAAENIKQEDVSPVAALSSLVGTPPHEETDLSIFWKVWGMLSEMYVDETALDKQQMIYGATKGMVASLKDPYTVYMTPDETKEFDQSLNGQLEGIGCELTVKDQALVVVSPLKDSPADKAGLKPGDIVYKIDGELTAEMTLFDAIMKIRGEKGTKVVLTIVRDGMDEPFEVGIVRDTVNIESVSMEDKGNGIFYISINQFNDSTKPEFEEKIRQLLLKEPKGLILDLRYNGGGYLDISVDILSEFLEGKVPAVTIKRRRESDNEIMYVSGKPQLPSVPLVVLINNGSASASEIVAGAIQDYERGIIMGQQSFGKGSVQEVDKLGDGSSIRMTIARWFTPHGTSIDKVGITPDMVVERKDEEFDSEEDPQLNAAIEYLRKL